MHGGCHREDDGGVIADLIYPVGSVFISTSDVSPETLFGGTWKRIEGRFLLCSGGGHDAGETGGEENHVLTVAEMPAHKHDIVAKENKSNNLGYNIVCDYPTSSYGFTGSTQATGLGAGHNNMPPFLAVNAWERVA